MAMTEVEKSSRSIMERTFYTKLGPTPAFPPSPAETGQFKPARAHRHRLADFSTDALTSLAGLYWFGFS